MTKHTSCVITFQKKNGDIIMRPRLDKFGLKIGDVTSMGWKVIDIHYQYEDGNYYHELDYRYKLDEARKKREPIKRKIANQVLRIVENW